MTASPTFAKSDRKDLSPRWLLAVGVAVLITEAAFWTYRHTGWQPATGPVYSWPAAFTVPPSSPKDLAAAMELFQADRGAHPAIPLVPRGRLVAYYFEWDSLKSAITSPASGHSPEVCNRALGYELHGVRPVRSWQGPAGSVDFEVTEFTSPDGLPVYVFKNIWFRGLGNWENRAVVKPWHRLDILMRHRLEEVRILTVGVFGLPTADAAWQAFSEQVLAHLEWKDTAQNHSSRTALP